MARHEVVIEGWHPASVNKTEGRHGHWSKGRKHKAADRERIAREFALAKVPRVATPRSVLRDARALGLPGSAVPPDEPSRTPCKRAVRLTIRLGPKRDPKGRLLLGGQEPDRDNLWKSLLDALAEGGWLVDDRSEWCDTPDQPRIVPYAGDGRPHAAVIVLEDLEP